MLSKHCYPGAKSFFLLFREGRKSFSLGQDGTLFWHPWIECGL